MPTINVTNLSANPLALPGNVYTSPVGAGATVSFDVDDLDEYLGLSGVADLVTRAIISIETATTDVNWRPTPSYTNALLPTDATVGMVVFNSTSGTLVRWSGSAWVALSLSNPVNIQVGLPAGTAGQLSYNTTTQSIMLYTGAAWDTVFVAPTGTTGAPPATAAALAGGAFFNTTTNRLSLHNGAAWMTLPVAHYDTAANIEVARGAVATAGQIGWASDLNRMVVYTGAAWFSDTTLGVYAPASATAANGVTIYDPTGFGATAANTGALRMYHSTAAAWMLPATVVRTSAVLPNIGDVPNGTLWLETTTHKLNVAANGAWAALH